MVKLRALASLVLVLAGCGQLIDRSTYTPNKKPVMLPYVATPDLELAVPTKSSKKITKTTFCQPNGAGQYAFDFQVTGGSLADPTNGKFFWGEGGGCIHRSLLDVWATSMNQGLMVWTGPGNSATFELATPPDGVARLFNVEYTHVEHAIMTISVKWKMSWHHTILLGTPRNPQRVLINYRRYFGTKHIKYWEGSIILTRLANDVTGVWARDQVRAAQITEKDARGSVHDIYYKLAEGEPARQYLP